jgi:hypothetical protein
MLINCFEKLINSQPIALKAAIEKPARTPWIAWLGGTTFAFLFMACMAYFYIKYVWLDAPEIYTYLFGFGTQCKRSENCTYAFVGVVTGLAIGCCTYELQVLAKHHGSDVRVVVWLCSAFMIFTFVFLSLAQYLGFFVDGIFTGNWAVELDWLYHFLFDIKTDLLIPSVLFVLFAVPEILTFVVAGSYGVASSTRLGVASDFLFWSYVKSTISIAGALMGKNIFFTLYPSLSGTNNSEIYWMLMMLLPLMMLFFAIVSLVIYKYLPFHQIFKRNRTARWIRMFSSRHNKTQV